MIPTLRVKEVRGHWYVDLVVSRRVKGKSYPVVEQVCYLGRLERIANRESLKRLALEVGGLSGIIALDGKGEEGLVEWTRRYGLRMVMRKKLEKLGVLEALRDLESKRRRYRLEDVVVAVVTYMVGGGGSKLEMMEVWEREELEGGANFCLHHVYRALDKVGCRWEHIEKIVRERSRFLFKEEARIVLCDFTSIYWESGEEDELRRYGWSKDSRWDCVQVVVGMVVNGEGVPVGVVVLPGDTSEKRGVMKLVEKVKQGYGLRGVVWIGDRGMVSEELIRSLRKEGIDVVMKVPRNMLNRGEKAQVEREEGWKVEVVDGESGEIKVESKVVRQEEGGERIVAIRWWDKRKEEIKEIEEEEREVREDVEGLRGKAKAVKEEVKKMVKRKWGGMVKIEAGEVKVDEKKIEEMKRWAGIELYYVGSGRDSGEVIGLYSKLRSVEECWRIMKGGVRVRPMWLHNSDRVKGHIYLSVVAVMVARLMEIETSKRGIEMSWKKIVKELMNMRVVSIRTAYSHLLRKRGQKSKFVQNLPLRVWIRQELSENQKRLLSAFGIPPLPRIVNVETLGGEKIRNGQNS